MLTILIKSFNRPHYLDRCIYSIIKNVSGNYQIKILDDGTPDVYLQKILVKYPQVDLEKSAAYNQKIQAIILNIEKGVPINGFHIPTDMWVNNVKKANRYVLVTEDDVWFTEAVNVDELMQQIKEHQMQLLKLGWLGNSKDDTSLNISTLTSLINTTQPKDLFTANNLIMNMFMFNRFKLFSILFKLGLVDNYTKRKYWALNSILMGLYDKEYWLYMWKDSTTQMNEKIQLKNAAVYYHKNKKNPHLVGRTVNEIMKTTFQSSASGSYHEYGINFDANRFNYILNEAWLKGDFDALENYPKDFSDDYIKVFLDKENHPLAQFNQWKQWADRFRQQYRNLGAQVDK